MKTIIVIEDGIELPLGKPVEIVLMQKDIKKKKIVYTARIIKKDE